MCIGLFFFPDHCTKQIDSMLPWVGVVKNRRTATWNLFLKKSTPSLVFFRALIPYSSFSSPRIFNSKQQSIFIHVTSIYANLLEQKKSATPLDPQVSWWLTRPPSTGVVTNTAAVPFFWNTNRVAVTSHFWLHFLFLLLFENIIF